MSEWEGKGREERVKRWFLKQAGCESLSLVARRPGSCLDPQPQSPQHTHVTSRLPCAAILGADLTFTLSSPSHTERLEIIIFVLPDTSRGKDNCSWHICGWAPTLDKDYRRYKSWTMAPLPTQNWKIALIICLMVDCWHLCLCCWQSRLSLSHAWSSLEMCQASQHWSLAVSHVSHVVLCSLSM